MKHRDLENIACLSPLVCEAGYHDWDVCCGVWAITHMGYAMRVCDLVLKYRGISREPLLVRASAAAGETVTCACWQ